MTTKSSPSIHPNRVRNPGAGDLGKSLKSAARKVPTTKTRATTAPPAPPRAAPVALLEEHSRDGELRSVTIEFHDPTAGEVYLAGSFNNWQPRATPMTRQRGGSWTATVLLRPGAYEYRVIVDGRWQEDFAAARFASNPYGGRNSVLEVHAAQP